MRLNPKYFNRFLLTCAIVFGVWVVYKTLDYRAEQQTEFDEKMAQTDSLLLHYYPIISSSDSLQLLSLYADSIQSTHRATALLFTASWSERGQDALTYLEQQYSDEINIVVALVKDSEPEALTFAQNHNSNFTYLDGMGYYNKMQPPGIPTLLLIDKYKRYYKSISGFKGEDSYKEDISALLMIK